jgi:hypothetical protein
VRIQLQSLPVSPNHSSQPPDADAVLDQTSKPSELAIQVAHPTQHAPDPARNEQSQIYKKVCRLIFSRVTNIVAILDKLTELNNR